MYRIVRAFSRHIGQCVDRYLMIDWKKHSWNPKRVSSAFTFASVCLSVCKKSCRAHILTFGMSDSWDMRKKTRIAFFFDFFLCLPFLLAFFDFFPLNTSSTFLFQVIGHIFFTMIFGMSETGTIIYWCFFFTVKWSFPRFVGNFSIKL